MSIPPSSQQELNSWKEIAEYLDVTVRTAQKWEEERGLPVHRLPGARGRVSAKVEEIEAWKASGAQQNHQTDALSSKDPPTNSQSPSRIRLPVIVISACLALVALLAVIYEVRNVPGVPFSGRVERNVMIVSDENGRELWRKKFSAVLEQDHYSLHKDDWAPPFLFIDLDGDGRKEVLFIADFSPLPQSHALFCYSDGGELKWQFSPARVVSNPLGKFDPVYSIRGLVVAPMGRNRPLSILVSSNHYLFEPCQIVLLSAKGEVIREYWHSGHLGSQNQIVVADLNNDGRNEIYLGGVSNGHKQATLVVLDPDEFCGASVEENHDFQLQGFPPGRERARVLFPQSCVSRGFFEEYNVVERLLIESGSIKVDLHERHISNPDSVIYHLTKDLRLQNVYPSDTFRAHHRELESSGRLNHPLTREDEAQFQKIRVFRSTDLPAPHPSTNGNH